MNKNTYMVINGERVEFTKAQLKQLGVEASPKYGQDYYFVMPVLSSDETTLEYKVGIGTGISSQTDMTHYLIRNYFLSKEEASRFASALNTELALRNFADIHNASFFNWNESVEKWYIRYDCLEDILKPDWTCFTRTGGNIYFSSRAVVEAAIKEIGEDKIKEYLTYDY